MICFGKIVVSLIVCFGILYLDGKNGKVVNGRFYVFPLYACHIFLGLWTYLCYKSEVLYIIYYLQILLKVLDVSYETLMLVT